MYCEAETAIGSTPKSKKSNCFYCPEIFSTPFKKNLAVFALWSGFLLSKIRDTNSHVEKCVLEIANCPWFVNHTYLQIFYLEALLSLNLKKALWRLYKDRFLIQIQCFGVNNGSFTDELLWMTLYQHPATLNWIFQKSE